MPPNGTHEQLLTPRDVGRMLGFRTARPIYRLIREGELPAIEISGKLLIEREDVQALISRARVKRKPARPGGLRELERAR